MLYKFLKISVPLRSSAVHFIFRLTDSPAYTKAHQLFLVPPPPAGYEIDPKVTSYPVTPPPVIHPPAITIMNTSLFRSALLAIAALALPHTANATLLVGFHSFDNSGGSGTDITPNDSDPSFSGVVSSTTAAGTTFGSVDGFYGPDSALAGGVATGVPSVNNGRIATSNGTTLNVKNNSASTYSLTSLLFDMASTNSLTGTGLTDITYQIFQGVTNIGSGALVTTGKVQGANTGDPLATISSGFNVEFPPGTNNTQNYSDFIADLTGISLGAGQNIVFTWATTGAVARIDNIAITAIPEPASLIALACVLGSGLFLRQRPRQLAPSLA